MKRYKLEGRRFGKLTVIEYTDKRYWLCKCDCGNTKIVRTDRLISNITKSCRCIKTGRKIKHGDSHTRLYGIYSHIKDRCYNHNHIHYNNYGGRGIVVCDEWLKDYSSFKKWAFDNGYNDKLSIDRIDVNGNYEPSNCKWSTSKEQANNKRDTIKIVYKGKLMTISELMNISGLSRYLIISRLNSNNPKFNTIEKVLFTPKDLKYAGKRK